MVAQIDKAYIRTRPSRLWPRLLSYVLFEGRPLTTKGRWFNPVVLGLARLLRKLPALCRVDTPVYILGAGRSGTTILGIVLSMHRGVGFLNEPKAVWAVLHPGEDLIGSYNRSPARYRLGTDDATPAIIRGAQRVFGGYLRLAGAHRLVDKYPELIFRTEFVRAIFPDARFLFLSRSGVATCGSIRQWSERLGTEVGGETHDWWGADDRKWHLLVDQIVAEHVDLAAHIDEMGQLNQEGRAAVEWIVTMREGLRLLADDPEGTLHVPYEALCMDPRGWGERLQKFIGLTSDKVFEDYVESTLSAPTSGTRELMLPNWLKGAVGATQRDLDLLNEQRQVQLECNSCVPDKRQ
jgi:hypothetical protein